MLPGRIPGYKRFDIKLLPSNYTKASVWRLYTAAMETAGERAVKVDSFRKLWRTLVPYIVKTRPMTDLCWICQKNNSAIYRSANVSDENKSERVRHQQAHLEKVVRERSLYQDMVRASKIVVEREGDRLGVNTAASKDITMHYSFDYAQQVHFPSDPMQPGPMYFLCPRKCGLFGVTCEGMPQQVTYLIDEGMAITKGANSVISYLDHFFANYGVGEMHVHLHCDNCSGQNKNNYLLWYLAWRVIHSLHLSVSLNFLITGHTKFGPDWCFGLIKQNYRRHMVSCLDDIVDVVKTSTVTGVNIPQKVGTEDGEVVVPQTDWQSFLRPFFRVMKGIKQFHHFRFDEAQPGVVFRKEFADSEEERCELLLDDEVLPPPRRPRPSTPPGLDNARKWYLHKKIREFCTPNTKDITCPQPDEEPESTSVVQPAVPQSVGPTSRSRGRGKSRPNTDDHPAAKRGRRGRH